MRKSPVAQYNGLIFLHVSESKGNTTEGEAERSIHLTGLKRNIRRVMCMFCVAAVIVVFSLYILFFGLFAFSFFLFLFLSFSPPVWVFVCDVYRTEPCSCLDKIFSTLRLSVNGVCHLHNCLFPWLYGLKCVYGTLFSSVIFVQGLKMRLERSFFHFPCLNLSLTLRTPIVLFRYLPMMVVVAMVVVNAACISCCPIKRSTKESKCRTWKNENKLALTHSNSGRSINRREKMRFFFNELCCGFTCAQISSKYSLEFTSSKAQLTESRARLNKHKHIVHFELRAPE